ncbi:NAD(+)/NADH kinase [Verrucomicrobiota bacterium]
MKKIGVIANCGKERAHEVLKCLFEKAQGLGLELFAGEAAAKLLGMNNVVPKEEMLDNIDAVMALGGDGTMLRAVRELDGRDKPVIGVNIGGLGFMTSVAEEDLERALQSLANDDFTMSNRTLAEGVVVRDGCEIVRYRALNDIVISRGPSSRVVSLDVSIGKDKVTSYVCDGVVVSTPTGSTGHSLSAGGPILTPETSAFVVSLICPHTLSSRPLVIPDNSEISIIISESAGDLLLSVDGQVGQPLMQSDSVKIRRSDRDVRFIHLPGYSYFSVLRQKLNWRGSNV